MYYISVMPHELFKTGADVDWQDRIVLYILIHEHIELYVARIKEHRPITKLFLYGIETLDNKLKLLSYEVERLLSNEFLFRYLNEPLIRVSPVILYYHFPVATRESQAWLNKRVLYQVLARFGDRDLCRYVLNVGACVVILHVIKIYVRQFDAIEHNLQVEVLRNVMEYSDFLYIEARREWLWCLP